MPRHWHHTSVLCVCLCACVRACVRACACVIDPANYTDDSLVQTSWLPTANERCWDGWVAMAMPGKMLNWNGYQCMRFAYFFFLWKFSTRNSARHSELVTHSGGTLLTSYKMFLAKRSSEKLLLWRSLLRETFCKKLKRVPPLCIFYDCPSDFWLPDCGLHQGHSVQN